MKKNLLDDLSITYVNCCRLEKYWIYNEAFGYIVFKELECTTCIDGYIVKQIAPGKNKY